MPRVARQDLNGLVALAIWGEVEIGSSSEGLVSLLEHEMLSASTQDRFGKKTWLPQIGASKSVSVG